MPVQNATNNSSYWKKQLNRLLAYGLPLSVKEHSNKDELTISVNRELFETGQDKRGDSTFEVTELTRILVHESGELIFSYFGHIDPSEGNFRLNWIHPNYR